MESPSGMIRMAGLALAGPALPQMKPIERTAMKKINALLLVMFNLSKAADPKLPPSASRSN
jgi:hypothetical protein